MRKMLIGAAFAALAMAAPVQAYEAAVGARVSTLGLGLELATGLTPKWDVRGVINGFNYDQDFDDDQNNKYNAKLKLFTVGGLADYHPFGGTFRLTGGALYNGFSVKAKTKDDQSFTYETDDFTYNGTGSAKGKFDFPSFAPYLGLGWGRPIKPESHYWFSFDLGVMFQGSLNADLAIRGSGTATRNSDGATIVVSNFEDNPTVQQDVKNYEKSLEHDAKDYQYWPVVGFGFGYKF